MDAHQLSKLIPVANRLAANEDILESELREMLAALGGDDGAAAADDDAAHKAAASPKKAARPNAGARSSSCRRRTSSRWPTRRRPRPRAKRLREKRQDAAAAEALRKGDAKLEPALAARAASLRRVWKREPKGHELFKIFDRNGKGFELAELHRMIRRDLRLKPADISDDEIAKLVKTLDVDGTGCIDVAALGEYADGKARAAWATRAADAPGEPRGG
ncbi:hypothetical protein SO694_00074026 [Aureococcus anophagefferens]|uniref:EF-hand domain-containing protein n=1 Tax=Aureococcus anophagefferens TaxID=44056 RepID=A0ABR1FHH9_AURAN